ncbi:MAG: DNA-processing protein DprA [Patescibacteria group bacterium]
METAWNAAAAELVKRGIQPQYARTIVEQRNSVDPELLQRTVEDSGQTIITIQDERYPALLKEIHSPPALLYIRGTLPPDGVPALAVVGTRRTSPYGRTITPRLVGDLARAGITIVSGLALGIDALAHRAALDAGGTTAAVLGCGLDTVYPRTNINLACSIIEQGGCLLSEYPPGTEPLRGHFPARNRIIAGLSKAVLVIEGADDSGSLITARCALDQNRDVLAVPGNITSARSRGPNALIKMGAALIMDTEDVLNALGVEANTPTGQQCAPKLDTDEEKILWDLLSSGPLHIDEINRMCKLNTSTINATLSMLEVKGAVQHLGGMRYTQAAGHTGKIQWQKHKRA